MAREDAHLQAERGLRARRPPAVLGVHDELREWSLTEYGYRWEIESGYRSIKRFLAATTSKDFGLRFFYFAFACPLYSIWRAVTRSSSSD
jgi:hypothetical protein